MFSCPNTCSRITDTLSHCSRSRPQPMLSKRGRNNELLNCNGNSASKKSCQIRIERINWANIFVSWTWFDKASLNDAKWKGYKPRHWYSCNSVQYTVRLHVLQALSQAVIGRFLVGLFLCNLQCNTRKATITILTPLFFVKNCIIYSRIILVKCYIFTR